MTRKIDTAETVRLTLDIPSGDALRVNRAIELILSSGVHPVYVANILQDSRRLDTLGYGLRR